MRVLAVDDQPDVVDVVVMLLEAAGHESRAAYGGPEALAAIAAEPFDAVILDVEMPGVTGIDVARAIRADPLTSHVAIAFATGRPEREVRAGFDGYAAFFHKPMVDGLDGGLHELELAVAAGRRTT